MRAMSGFSDETFAFGRFRLNAAERCLFEGKTLVRLTPKVFDTLLLLVENCGHVLSKEKMLSELWAGRFVEENNLAQNISAIRRSLGETDKLKFIETIPKYGYRFIATVSRNGDEIPNGDPASVIATFVCIRLIKRRNSENDRSTIEKAKDNIDRCFKLYKGKSVVGNGNILMAAFDRPALAIRSAFAAADCAGKLGVSIATGIHTGESEVIGERFSGFANGLAQKIAEISKPGSILVSRTVKDLVAGSSFVFEELGVRRFNASEGEWRIFTIKK